MGQAKSRRFHQGENGEFMPINYKERVITFYLLSLPSIDNLWQIMFVSKNLFSQTGEKSYHYNGRYHLHLLGLHLALRHHLHDAWQQTCSLAEGCYPVIQQQSYQPCTLHLHQQAGEEGHHENVHHQGARTRPAVDNSIDNKKIHEDEFLVASFNQDVERIALIRRTISKMDTSIYVNEKRWKSPHWRKIFTKS